MAVALRLVHGRFRFAMVLFFNREAAGAWYSFRA